MIARVRVRDIPIKELLPVHPMEEGVWFVRGRWQMLRGSWINIETTSMRVGACGVPQWRVVGEAVKKASDHAGYEIDLWVCAHSIEAD